VTIPNRFTIQKVLNDHGYKLSSSYIAPNFWKTNAPMDLIYDIMKSWKLSQAAHNKEDPFNNLPSDSPAHKALSQELK